ncbi:MAG: hypothetical protein IPL38_18545 [Rhodobacter sp.]|nr:hypothetical protein [Rhodobacter sp.]MBK8441412.1 hypothetical protein [Rhodobacter sp.]
MRLEEADPKGLVRESYRIDGITPGECRSIFVDWALSLPVGRSTPDALRALIAHYALAEPDHPMSPVLEAGLAAPDRTGRRGGRGARIRSPQADEGAG